MRDYGDARHFFEKHQEKERALEIKFIRRDGTVCGASWDVFMLPREEQCIWRFVSDGIQNLIFDQETHINEWVIKKNLLEKIQRALLAGDISVHPIYGIEPLEREDMAEIVYAHMVNPWVLALTDEALSSGTPGAVSITAPDSECCLLREPTVNPLAGTAVQPQTVDLIALQTMVQELSEKTHNVLERLAYSMQNLEHRMTALEAMHQRHQAE